MITCTFENGRQANLRHVVVHTLVEKDGALLLGKRTGPLLESGKWGLPGGFLDRRETASECAVRELLEETGWRCAVDKLFRINTNPNRPMEDRQNVAIEFICKPLKKVEEPDSENSKIEWIPISKLLPFNEFAFDHGETIKLYLQYRQNKFPLPLFI